MRRLSLQHALITLLSPTVLCLASTPFLSQQSSNPPSPGSPQTMRLCVGSTCDTLNWNGSSYDGVRDHNPQVVMHYTVSQWSRQGVRLEGRSVSPAKVDDQRLPGAITLKKQVYAEAVYTGTISADGNSIDAGKMNLQIGRTKSEYMFTLTWDAEPSGTLAAATAACPQGLSTAAAPPSGHPLVRRVLHHDGQS